MTARMKPLSEEVAVPGGGGGSSSSETVTVTSTDTGTVDIMGLDDVSVTLSVPDPITTNSTTTLAVPDPIKNDITTKSDVGLTSDLTLDVKPLETTIDIKPLETTIDVKPLETTIDLKPVVVDLCYTVNIGRLPETRVRQPYRHHVGLTLFGTEVLGMTFEGEQDTVIEDLHRQPMVVEGREYFEHGYREGRRRDDGDGLHIRVGP
jgi:hypothetical protein